MKNDQLEKEGDALEVKVGRIHQDYHTTVVSAVKHKMWSISRQNSQKGNRNLRNKTFLIYIFFPNLGVENKHLQSYRKCVCLYSDMGESSQIPDRWEFTCIDKIWDQCISGD